MKKIFIILGTVLLLSGASPAQAAKPNSSCQTIQSGALVDSANHPITLGYDQWGYNYQAHSFNGWYDNYSRPTTPFNGGNRLQMKWNDAWLSNQSCDGNNLLDRHFGSTTYIGSGAWLTNHASGTYEGNWNLVGSHIWTVLGSYAHDVVIESQNTDGTFIGHGGYPAGAATYETTEAITGSVSGNKITLTTVYNGPYNTGYTATAEGTIESDGSIHGSTPWYWVMTNSAEKQVCEWSDFVKIVAAPEGATMGGTNWKLGNQVIGPAIWGDFAIVQEESSDPCGQMLDLLDFKSFKPGLGNW